MRNVRSSFETSNCLIFWPANLPKLNLHFHQTTSLSFHQNHANKKTILWLNAALFAFNKTSNNLNENPKKRKKKIQFISSIRESKSFFFSSPKIIAYNFFHDSENFVIIIDEYERGRDNGRRGFVCIHAFSYMTMMINTRKVWKINDFFAFLLLIFMIWAEKKAKIEINFCASKICFLSRRIINFYYACQFVLFDFYYFFFSLFSPFRHRSNFFLICLMYICLLLKWLSIKME